MSTWLSRMFQDNVLLVIFLCPSCFLGESAMTNSVLLNVVIRACGVKCGPATLTRLEIQTQVLNTTWEGQAWRFAFLIKNSFLSLFFAFLCTWSLPLTNCSSGCGGRWEARMTCLVFMCSPLLCTLLLSQLYFRYGSTLLCHCGRAWSEPWISFHGAWETFDLLYVFKNKKTRKPNQTKPQKILVDGKQDTKAQSEMWLWWSLNCNLRHSFLVSIYSWILSYLLLLFSHLYPFCPQSPVVRPGLGFIFFPPSFGPCPLNSNWYSYTYPEYSMILAL